MPTTRNEKRLIWILLAFLFVSGNYYGYRWLAQRQSSQQLRLAELKADQAEAKVALSESDLWAQRNAWIAQHQPVLGDEGDAKAQVLEAVLKGARDNKLEIIDQSLNDSLRGAAGTQINVSVKVKGSMQGLATWLTALQKPDQFFAISSFSLRADQDQKSMLCTVRVARYFKDK